MKKNNKKGFTLAELLIVVAIIAVLVAVAIPVFSAQLEKSRDATSAANLRSAYSEASVAYMTGDGSGANITLADNVVTVADVQLLDTDKDLGDAGDDLPFDLPTLPGTKGPYDVQFTFDKTTGAVTCDSIS